MQKNIVMPIAIVISGLIWPLLLVAENMPEYANVKGWSIRIDTTLNNGCFAYVEYERGSMLRIGVDNRDDSMYMVFGNEAWSSIEYQKEYEVQIQFGNKEKWEGAALGMSFDPPNDQPFLWIRVTTRDAVFGIISEFMKEHNVQLFYNGNSIDNLRLRGSYAAGLKLMECQEVMRSNSKDPFSEPVRKKDPFAA